MNLSSSELLFPGTWSRELSWFSPAVKKCPEKNNESKGGFILGLGFKKQSDEGLSLTHSFIFILSRPQTED